MIVECWICKGSGQVPIGEIPFPQVADGQKYFMGGCRNCSGSGEIVLKEIVKVTECCGAPLGERLDDGAPICPMCGEQNPEMQNLDQGGAEMPDTNKKLVEEVFGGMAGYAISHPVFADPYNAAISKFLKLLAPADELAELEELRSTCGFDDETDELHMRPCVFDQALVTTRLRINALKDSAREYGLDQYALGQYEGNEYHKFKTAALLSDLEAQAKEWRGQGNWAASDLQVILDKHKEDKGEDNENIQ
jgi:hypothetical protein